MFQVNPVLAGTIGTDDYARTRSNINASAANSAAVSAAGQDTDTTSSATSTTQIDDRRYTKFDRSASQTDTADLSFSDVLDAINPLQHIPIVSAVYRDITDEKINPISRVAGDALYGGIFGVGSVILGAVGAIGDEIMINQTGHSMAGMVMAAVFGSDKDAPASGVPDIQLAANDLTSNDLTSQDPNAPMRISSVVDVASNAAAPQATVAADKTEKLDITSSDILVAEANAGTVAVAAQTLIPGAVASAPLENITPAITPVAPVAVAAGTTPVPAAAAPVSAPTTVASASPFLAAKSYPIDMGKKPYGGVLDTSTLSPPSLSMLMAQDNHAIQIGHTIYPGRTNTVPRTVPAVPLNAPTPTPAAAASTTATPATPSTAQADSENPLMGDGITSKALIADLLKLQEFKKLPSTASAAPAQRGAILDLTN